MCQPCAAFAVTFIGLLSTPVPDNYFPNQQHVKRRRLAESFHKEGPALPFGVLYGAQPALSVTPCGGEEDILRGRAEAGERHAGRVRRRDVGL